MKTLWNSTNYNNDLKLTRRDADYINGSGDMVSQVKEVMGKRYVKKQLDNINPAQLVKELNGFGAWDENQLADHKENLIRWVWISACDISEEN